jgi:hypothetical protein
MKPLRIWLTPDWWAATCTAPSTERKRAQRTSISPGVGAIRRRSWSEAEGRRCRGESPLLGDDLATICWRKHSIQLTDMSLCGILWSIDRQKD